MMGRAKHRITLLGILTFAPAIPGQINWQEVGPAPIATGAYTGRIAAIAASPTKAGLYYAAGADGGIWRTKNGGGSWQALTDLMPTTAMGALALAPSNEQIIYAGTGESNHANHSRYGLGIYKSVDGGDNWTHLAEEFFKGRCFSRIAVDPGNPAIVYASITTAGGFPALAAARGHTGAKGPLGIFKSVDGGVSFTQLTKGIPVNLSATDVAIDPANSAVVYAAFGRVFGDSRNGVYKSVDGGLSFSKMGGGLATTGVGRVRLALAPSKPGRVFASFVRACTSAGGGASTLNVYRSDNWGKSWTSLNPGNYQASYGWYLCTSIVHPTNPDLVFLGGFSILRSTNAGSLWQTRTAPHVDNHAFAWDAQGRLLVGSDGGVFRTANNGDLWTSINNNLGTVQFYAGLSQHPKYPGRYYAGFQDNGSCYRSIGTSWSQVLGGDGGCTGISADGARIFVEYQGTGNLYRSVSGGSFRRSSSGITGRNCFLPPFAIDANNPLRMVYGTERAFLSADGGTSWTAVSPDLSGGSGAIQGLALAPGRAKYLYAATNDGRISMTADGGKNWHLRLTGVPSWPRITRPFAVSPRDPRRVYLAVAWFGREKLLYSADGGVSWTNLAASLPDFPAHTVALDSRVDPPVLYLGTDYGVWRSIDHGRRWDRLGVNLPSSPVVDLLLDLPRKRVVVATEGRGLWTCPLLKPTEVEPKGQFK